MRNSTSTLKPLETLDRDFTVISDQADKHDALLKSVEGRFAGNSALYQLFAKDSIKKGDAESAANYYRESIKWQPNAWQAYMDLGTLLIEQGELDKADKVFMDYPGFKKNSEDNPVGISDYAYQAGSKFYWMGEFSLATPFYEIASRRETGSAAEMTSLLRLALLNGDYKKALLGSLERAQRYNDTHAYRDYLGMLFAMGASKEAWDAFDILANQTNAPYIWESVLVGHHMEGLSEKEIAAWVKQEVAHNTGSNSNLAAKYLLRAGITDRTPSPEFETQLIDVAQPVWKIDDANGSVVQPSDDGKVQTILGPQTLK
ncbi:MAG: tetratricopeptide repeat protein, partial [Gallionella sp.]